MGKCNQCGEVKDDLDYCPSCGTVILAEPIQGIAITGRDKPVLEAVPDSDGITLRIDFELRPAGWVQIRITKDQLIGILKSVQEG